MADGKEWRIFEHFRRDRIRDKPEVTKARLIDVLENWVVRCTTMDKTTTNHDHVCASDVTFRFPDGHTWRYAGCEQVWMHEVPIGAEWEDCQVCDALMEKIGEPPLGEIPFEVVAESKIIG